MFDGGNIQVGCGRYYQCHGALRYLGEEAAYWGKKAYIVTDKTVWEKVGEKVDQTLKKHLVDYMVNFFMGPSTQASFDLIASEINQYGADIVVGIGGGRSIDIAKGASDVSGKRVITVPTSSATCAAVAILYVTYGEDGSVEKSQFLKYEISSVIVDLDIVALNCPVRYLMSGIADAMAKEPEFIFTMQNLGAEGQTATSDTATLMARYTYQTYKTKWLQALRDANEVKATAVLEDVICANLMLTGMVSNLSTGGKQLAIAHNFYDAVCCLRKEIRAKYLHGEIVGMAIPLQMTVNGASAEDVEKTKKMIHDMGIPNTMEKMGFDLSAEAVKELVDYTHKKTMPDNQDLYKAIEKGFEVILR